jgi:hypothetical protein
MKKLLFVLFMTMAAVAVNAQHTPVKAGDLPKAISEYLAKDYSGFTIQNAVKMVENNVVSYEVTAVKGTTHETLLFDKDGKFEKKVNQKVGMVESHNQNHTTQVKHQPNTVVKK